MSDREASLRFPIRTMIHAGLIWLASAGLMILLFSFLFVRTSASETTFAYFSSALTFLSACAAGSYLGSIPKGRLLLNTLLFIAVLIPALLLIGFFVDNDRIDGSAVLSMVSFTIAGSLFGAVFLTGHKKRSSRRSFKGGKR